MQRLILMSVLIATFAIPAVIARHPAPVGYAAVFARFCAFTCVYVLLLLLVYPRLF